MHQDLNIIYKFLYFIIIWILENEHFNGIFKNKVKIHGLSKILYLNDQALEIYKSVLETKIRVCGHDSPDVCDSFYNLACAHATRDSMLCRDMLLKAEQTGFVYLLKEHMKTDSDLDAVRELEWYKELVGRI